MTLALQRLLLSASVLICLAVAVTGTTTRGNTPARSTTTRRGLIEGPTTTTMVSPARQGLTPTRPSSTVSRGPTPARSTTLISPARLDQTPTKSNGGGSSGSMRPTPTTTARQSSGSIRPTPVTSPQNVVANSTTSVSLRPTPAGTVSPGAISRRDTPSSTARNGGGVSTSFMSQAVSSMTPIVTQFSPIAQSSTSMFTQKVSFESTTPFMTQPQGSSSMGSASMGSASMGSASMGSGMSGSTTSGVSGSTISGGGSMSSGGGLQTNATISGGSMTSGGGGMNGSMTTGGGGGGTTVSQGPGGGQLIHVQLMLCNMYSGVQIPNDPANYYNQLQRELARYTGVPEERFVNLFAATDPETKRMVLQFDVYPGPGKLSNDIVEQIKKGVAAKTFNLTDMNGVKLDCNCDPANPIYPWTDYGPCPTQPCMNGGRCNVALTGKYYCKCPPEFSGPTCSIGGGGVTNGTGASVTAQGSPTSPSPMAGTSSGSGGQQSSPGGVTTGAVASSAGQSGVSGGMTTQGGGGDGGQGGQAIHVQIIFCNDYFSMYGPIDPNQRVGYTSHLQGALASAVGAAPERIQGLFLVSDPRTGRVTIQFDVVPGPGVSSDQIVVMLSNRVSSKSFSLSDINRSVLYMNCYDSPSPPIFPWTDYGPCPYERCRNNGRCNVKVTGEYYCECRQPFTGKYCDGMGEKSSSNNNLLWLLTIPAAVGLLSLLICCLCCWNRQCCCFAQRSVKVVEVIDDDVYQDVDTRSIRSVRSCASHAPSYCPPMMMNDPGGTYYHALGRPFAVAFNDNTFSAVGYATNDMGLYSTTGAKRRSLCGDEEIQVIMNGRGSCCGSDYHSAGMGNKYAVAYNDRTFNTYSSMPRYDRIHNYN